MIFISTVVGRILGWPPRFHTLSYHINIYAVCKPLPKSMGKACEYGLSQD